MSNDRKAIVSLVNAARASGARQSTACDVIGISAKTFQRWSDAGNVDDGRLEPSHVPSNKLTELERQRILKVVNEPAYVDLAPSQIVPKLADEGRYIGSESTLYRILKAAKQLQHRQKTQSPSRNGPEPSLHLGHYLSADTG